MLSINDVMQIHMQCKDENGNIGTFLTSKQTGKQFGDTYKNFADLQNGYEVKFCNSHNIKLIYPGKEYQDEKTRSRS